MPTELPDTTKILMPYIQQQYQIMLKVWTPNVDEALEIFKEGVQSAYPEIIIED